MCLSSIFERVFLAWTYHETSTGNRVAQTSVDHETSTGNRYDEVFSDEFEESFEDEEISEKRCNVINELLTTEKDYLDCLEIVRDNFIHPIKSQNVLASDEMEIIFINWNDVLLCTNRLYKSLKIRRKMNMKKDINIGDVLCENVIFF